jgi:hypothetical protein
MSNLKQSTMIDQAFQSVENLLEERKRVYGDTWLIVGDILEVGPVQKEFLHLTAEFPKAVHNWILIMSKMIRVLYTPHDADHWRDIAGYATLMYKYLEGDNR